MKHSKLILLTFTATLFSQVSLAKEHVELDCNAITDECYKGQCFSGKETRHILSVNDNSVENIDGDYGFLTFKNSCELSQTHLECFEYREASEYIERSLTLNPMTGQGTINIKVYDSVESSNGKIFQRKLTGSFSCKKFVGTKLF